MQGIFITPKMAVSICKNGNTLQILDLHYSVFGESGFFPYPNSTVIRLDNIVPTSNNQKLSRAEGSLSGV